MRLRTVAFLFSLALLFAPALALATPGDVVAKFPTPSSRPTGLTFDGKSLWMADRVSGFLYEINPADGSVLRKLTAPSYNITGLTYGDGYLWALDPEVRKIFKCNPKTGITENDFAVSLGHPQGLTFDGKFLWVCDYRRECIDKISTEDGTRIARIPAPSVGAYGLTFDGKYLWVADRLDDKIYMVAPRNGDAIVTFNSPGKYPRGMAFDGKNLWNVDFQARTIYKLVRDDGTQFSRTNGKKLRLEFVNKIRNYGPGLVTTADISMAIPRNLPGQQLLAGPRFSPNPTDVLTDQWGQKAAHYRFRDVAPGEEVETKMNLDTELFTVRYYLFPEKVGTLADIPKEIKDLYLRDGSKFMVNDPFMQKTAKKVVGNEKNCYWITRRILDHITSKMHYNLDGVWDVAPTVLKKGSGSCSEYSFVFVALCRAAGLPARYVGSIVVRYDDASTDNVYHRWPEVYMPNYGWIPIDPSSGHGIFRHPADKANVIGYRLSKYMITTIGGGGSTCMGWEYNSYDQWQYKGPCKVQSTRYGEWEPLDEPEANKADK